MLIYAGFTSLILLRCSSITVPFMNYRAANSKILDLLWRLHDKNCSICGAHTAQSSSPLLQVRAVSSRLWRTTHVCMPSISGLEYEQKNQCVVLVTEHLTTVSSLEKQGHCPSHMESVYALSAYHGKPIQHFGCSTAGWSHVAYDPCHRQVNQIFFPPSLLFFSSAHILSPDGSPSFP